MREIKFRAWHKKTKEMKQVIGLELQTMEIRVGEKEWWFRNFAILMQYTGLKEKSGKEIYEGDILSGDFPDLVFWDDDKGQWGLRNSENFDDTLWEIIRDNNPEIIGNIYENPELLSNTVDSGK